MKTQLTTVYYAQILKSDNKWYYVKNSPFYRESAGAHTHARVYARNNPDTVKDIRVISKDVQLNEFGAIIS